MAMEDAQLRRLRYHLLRLTLAGLTPTDVTELSELGRLAFEGLDLTKQLAHIQQRTDASPLALTITDIVARAGQGQPAPVTPQSVLLGAVLGAYASVGNIDRQGSSLEAVFGAIGGAIAVATYAFIVDINQGSWTDYVETDE
jgi:hypothetical protein